MLRTYERKGDIMRHHSEKVPICRGKEESKMPMVEFLKGIDLFADMTEEEIEFLLKCSGALVKTYEKGQEIFQENQISQYLYVLLEGKLLMSKHFSSGRRNIFCEIHEKEVFGILIHIKEKETYWYDAVAVTDCKVLAISWDYLFGICPKSCEVHKNFVKNMIRVQADISVSQMKKLNILSGVTVEAKLGLLMLELMDEEGLVDFKMNREELADFLGITRPSLSRSLMNMQGRGVIQVKRSQVKILDLNELEKLCIH